MTPKGFIKLQNAVNDSFWYVRVSEISCVVRGTWWPDAHTPTQCASVMLHGWQGGQCVRETVDEVLAAMNEVAT